MRRRTLNHIYDSIEAYPFLLFLGCMVMAGLSCIWSMRAEPKPLPASPSLLFDASLERVNHGSAASLDDIGAGFFCAEVYVTDWTADTGNQWIFQKNGISYGLWIDGFAGQVFFQIGRATTPLQIQATPAQLGGHWVVNGWLLICAVWDTAGADGAQHLYTGTRTVALVEPGTYAARQAGTGAVTSNAANDLTVGGHSVANQFLKGRVAWAMLGNAVKTLPQLESLRSRPFKYDSTVVLYTQYGWAGTGTQPDLSGNGNNGTVTGATVADHAPHARWP